MYLLQGNATAPSMREHFNQSIKMDCVLCNLPASIGKFASGEAFSELKLLQKLNGAPVIVQQSLASVGDHSPNDFAMELLFAIRTLKRNGAGPIWVSMPYMAYARQDREFEGRMTSIAIDDFGAMLKEAGAVGMSTVELHSSAGLKFLKNHFGAENVFNLDPTEIFAADIENRLGLKSGVVGGPDNGANARKDALVRRLGFDEFSIVKKHLGVNETQVKEFNGDVKDRITITVDDMIDTGGTIENSQIRLAQEGAKERYVYTSLPLFSNNGLERLFTSKTNDGSPSITQIIFTDAVDTDDKILSLKRQYDVSGLPSIVDSRTYVLGVGPMIYEHLKKDVVSHPAMKMGGL